MIDSIRLVYRYVYRINKHLYPFIRYRLGQSLLIPLGAAESFQAGLDFGSRYRSLIDPQRLPFIRASLSPRVVDSATNFTHGLFSSLGYDHPKKKIEPIDPLLISEDPQSNNTLDDNSCPNRIPSIEKLVWLKIFASPVTEDLNRLAPESNLDNEDTLALMQLCIFESLADSKLSPFCNLFKRDDWLAFGFYYDLDKYYGHGIPNDLARLEGSAILPLFFQFTTSFSLLFCVFFFFLFSFRSISLFSSLD